MGKAHPWVFTSVLAAVSAWTVGCLRVPADLEDPTGYRAAPTTAAEVLSRHIEAIGGVEKVRGVRQRTVEARMVFLPDEGCETGDEGCLAEEQKGSFVLQQTADGKMYRRTVLSGLVEEKGFDGENGWMMADGQIVLEDPKDVALSRDDARLHWYFEPDKHGIEVTVLPPRDRDFRGETRVLDGLRWKIVGADTAPKSMWFDRATGLLREEVVEDGTGDGASRQTIVYDDYRAVDAVLVPHRITLVTKVADRARTVEFSTTKVEHAAIDDAVFAVPTLPPAEKKPDGWLTKLAEAKENAQQRPKDADALVGWARAAFAAARFDEAMQAAEKTLAVDANEPEALWILVRAKVLSGDYRGAERFLGRAAKAGIRREEIAKQRAWIHSHRGEYRRLAAALDEAGSAMLAGRYRSFAGTPLQLASGDCVVTIPFTVTDPAPRFELTLQGDHKVVALLDTGATDLILADSVAAALEIPIQSRTPLGGQGPDVEHGQLAKLALGGAVLRNVPVDVFDARAIANMAGEKTTDVKAVLGMRPLEKFQVTIDIPAKTLELVPREARCRKQAQARRTGGSVGFWVHETHFVYLRADMNGAEGLYLLNTGMRGVGMTATRLAYGHAGIGAPTVRAGDPALVQIARVGLTDVVSVEKIEGAYGFFEQSQSTDGFRIDGMLGLPVLAQRRFTIDFDEQRIYFP